MCSFSPATSLLSSTVDNTICRYKPHSTVFSNPSFRNQHVESQKETGVRGKAPQLRCSFSTDNARVQERKYGSRFKIKQ